MQDLESFKLKKVLDPVHLKKGIQTLMKRTDIAIHPADKGGGIAIQSKEQYQGELNRQLYDKTTYEKLLGNPTMKYKKELEQIVHLGTKKDILNKKEGKYLIPESCRIPVIYTIPKIHKD